MSDHSILLIGNAERVHACIRVWCVWCVICAHEMESNKVTIIHKRREIKEDYPKYDSATRTIRSRHALMHT